MDRKLLLCDSQITKFSNAFDAGIGHLNGDEIAGRKLDVVHKKQIILKT